VSFSRKTVFHGVSFAIFRSVVLSCFMLVLRLRFSAPVQTGPRFPVQCEACLFPGVEQPGSGVYHALPYSAEVKERI
jgi:hypothetical protein